VTNTLKPGRELDALVAEKVMGLSFKKMGNKYVYQIPCPEKRKGCAVWHGEEVSPYSIDIAAAWEVVEKVKGFLFSRRKRFKQELSNIFTHNELKISPEEWVFLINPHAICLAALKAVNFGDKND